MKVLDSVSDDLLRVDRHEDDDLVQLAHEQPERHHLDLHDQLQQGEPHLQAEDDHDELLQVTAMIESSHEMRQILIADDRVLHVEWESHAQCEMTVLVEQLVNSLQVYKPKSRTIPIKSMIHSSVRSISYESTICTSSQSLSISSHSSLQIQLDSKHISQHLKRMMLSRHV